MKAWVCKRNWGFAYIWVCSVFSDRPSLITCSVEETVSSICAFIPHSLKKGRRREIVQNPIWHSISISLVYSFFLLMCLCQVFYQSNEVWHPTQSRILRRVICVYIFFWVEDLQLLSYSKSVNKILKNYYNTWHDVHQLDFSCS